MVSKPTLTDYSSAEQWLLSITDFERLLGSPALRYDTQTFDLERFRQQLTELGDPHLKYGVVHVAGTKGKGSTCAFLEAVFRACGYRTGLYTSPHLHRFTERIRVNGNDIPDQDFSRLVEAMGARMASASSQEVSEMGHAGFRTVFEILTAAAFQYFGEQAVDVAIIETGLGGRLDSTNMFDRPGAGPLVNVITAIGLDHTSILGDSVEAIAGEKAGIIRPHAKVVVAAQADGQTEDTVRRVVAARSQGVGNRSVEFAGDLLEITRAAQAGCYVYRLRREGAEGLGGAAPGEVGIALQAGLEICPSLHGYHQAQNIATALAALMAYAAGEHENGQVSHLSPGAVKSGLEHTQWAGRFQQAEMGGVDFVVDGAHCALSAAALGRACRDIYGDRPAVVIVGFLRDKAGSEILDGLFSAIPVTGAWAVAPPTPRAASGDFVFEALHERLHGTEVHRTDTVEQAMADAANLAKASGAYVVVYGSLYLVGPALDVLRA
jgi:dihydrofolate synthase/folylpolyglutamate synthase